MVRFKSFLFLSLTLFSGIAISAPVNESTVNFGVQAGLNFSNANIYNSSATSTVTGFEAGPYAEAPLITGLLYFQPELNFIQKGADNSVFGTSGVTRLNYLELPLFAKAKVDINTIKLFALAGPSFALLLGSSGPGSTSNRLSSVDVGFKIGAGIGIATSERSEVTITVRKAFGITQIDTPSQWKTSGFELLLGYLF